MTDREPVDPLAGLRAMAEIQRAGLEAATAVVERMLEMSRLAARGRFPVPLPAEPAGARNGDAPEAQDPARELRRLRADGERMLELWGEWIRLLLEAAADAAEAGLDGAGGAVDRLSLGPVPPAGRARGRVWLHVLDGPPAAPARLSATALTAHDGSQIAGAAVTFEPPTIDTSTPRSSQEVMVTIVVPEGAAPGIYHGHVLAAGLPEIDLPLRLEVSS